MASTNKTTNLDLSQFVGTDKPDWLTDYNADMGKIDAWTATAESDISTATADASSAKTTANAASTAANQATTTAGNALSATSKTNTNIANWQGTDSYDCDSFWDASKKLTIKYNKTLGLLMISGYLFSSSKINNNQVVCTLPSECWPASDISLRNAGFVSTVGGETSNCAFNISPTGVFSFSRILNSSIDVTQLYLDITLSCAGWGNNWPPLNN